MSTRWPQTCGSQALNVIEIRKGDAVHRTPVPRYPTRRGRSFAEGLLAARSWVIRLARHAASDTITVEALRSRCIPMHIGRTGPEAVQDAGSRFVPVRIGTLQSSKAPRSGMSVSVPGLTERIR